MAISTCPTPRSLRPLPQVFLPVGRRNAWEGAQGPAGGSSENTFGRPKSRSLMTWLPRNELLTPRVCSPRVSAFARLPGPQDGRTVRPSQVAHSAPVSWQHAAAHDPTFQIGATLGCGALVIGSVAEAWGWRGVRQISLGVLALSWGIALGMGCTAHLRRPKILLP